MNAMMRETLLTGTARKAELPGWEAAGKTGTSQEFRDAWFVGYTGSLVAGVWLGNDDGTPTKKVSGGNLPVEIWSRFMKTALAGQPPVPLPGGDWKMLSPAPPGDPYFTPAPPAEPGTPMAERAPAAPPRVATGAGPMVIVPRPPGDVGQTAATGRAPAQVQAQPPVDALDPEFAPAPPRPPAPVARSAANDGAPRPPGDVGGAQPRQRQQQQPQGIFGRLFGG